MPKPQARVRRAGEPPYLSPRRSLDGSASASANPPWRIAGRKGFFGRLLNQVNPHGLLRRIQRSDSRARVLERDDLDGFDLTHELRLVFRLVPQPVAFFRRLRDGALLLSRDAAARDPAQNEHAANGCQSKTAPRTACEPIKSQHTSTKYKSPAAILSPAQVRAAGLRRAGSFELIGHCSILQRGFGLRCSDQGTAGVRKPIRC